MKPLSIRTAVGFTALLVLSSVLPVSAQDKAKNSIQGAWTIVERDRPDGTKDTNPPPSIRMFTAKHYSWVQARPERPGQAGNPVSATTPAFNGATGTYEAKGNQLMAHAVIGGPPELKASTYEIKLQGDVLLIRRTKPTLGQWTKYRRLE